MDQNQECSFLIRDNSGHSRIVDDFDQTRGGQYDCTKFNSRKLLPNKQGNASLFIDSEFPISPTDVQKLQQKFGEKIILKRMCRLFPKLHRPPLFAESANKSGIPREAGLPPFIHQMWILGPQPFKKIILNTSISDNGRYEIMVNVNGKYEVQVIDDIVPIIESTHEHIWSSCLREPWQVIMMKVEAKLQGGFSKLKSAESFQFIKHATEANWKYFSLASEAKSFFSLSKDKVGKNCKILLKSKASQKIQQYGLVSGRVGYELVDVDSTSSNIVLMMRTSFENAWTGKFSIVDKSLKFTQKMKEGYKISYTLTLNHQDFLNMFSTAYVTHANLPLPIYRSFYSFKTSPSFNAARYFQFQISREGFFNFSIHQPESNMVKIPIGQSKYLSESNKTIVDGRFLSYKYILSRRTNAQNSRMYFEELDVSKVGALIRESMMKFDEKYNPLEYELYEAGHKSGFSKASAHFMTAIPGTYLLRVKAEPTSIPSTFVIHYSAHQPTEIQEIQMTKQDSAQFLSQNMISISDQVPHESFSKQKYECFSIADRTDTLGYAFAVLKVDKKCPYRAAIEVDPQQLYDEGYKLKNTYKRENKVFKVEVGSGESKAIVFKRIADRRQYVWPTQAFQVIAIKN